MNSVHPERINQIKYENESEKEICRDYLYNKCTRTNCHFVHTEKKPKQICRDYLNGKCTRVNCYFIHQEPKKGEDKLELTIKNVCRNFMNKKCVKEDCKFIHNTRLCKRFWKNGSCKFKDNCKKEHFITMNSNPYYLVKEQKKLQKKSIMVDITDELTKEEMLNLLINKFPKVDNIKLNGISFKLTIVCNEDKDKNLVGNVIGCVIKNAVENVIDNAIESIKNECKNEFENIKNECENIINECENEFENIKNECENESVYENTIVGAWD